MVQPEPKLFRAGRRRDTRAAWRLAGAALSLVALGAGAFGYLQYNTVRTLKAQLAQATAEAHQAGAEATQLRAQLNEAQNRINSQGTKLTAAQQEVSSEQQELSEAEQQAVTGQQQLAAVERQIEQEKRRLHDVQTQLAAESRPDLPVRLVFFAAPRAGAKGAVLQNLSGAELDLTLDVQTPGSTAHIHKQLLLTARGSLRMGPAQGWKFTPGQVVTLDNAKFRRIVQTVT